jgi:hypothetical protein
MKDIGHREYTDHSLLLDYILFGTYCSPKAFRLVLFTGGGCLRHLPAKNEM